MSASCVGTESFIPYLEGTKSSGDMNVIVRLSNCVLDDIGWIGSRTIVIRPKSVRQARGGVVFVIRMFACQTLGIMAGTEDSGTNPFEVSVCENGTMEILQTLGCPVQLLSHSSEGSGGEIEFTY